MRAIGVVGLFLCATFCRADEPSAKQIEFFEKKIRPVFVQHCYECHSKNAKRLKGGLRLDTKKDLRSGGESGRVIVPGDPRKSLLLKALRHEDLRMPPKGKLPEAVVADFEAWIRMGAPDPRTASASIATRKIDFEKAREHWAFRPIQAPRVPSVHHADWASSPIDHFIIRKLEEHGIVPAPRADRHAQIRRLYFDLLGLPPTYDEVAAFEQDESPNAWVKLVDRLLASPRYGERWGRHWLDVARYADTKDQVLLYGKDRIRPFAYTYRDYVIRAFNRDLPYDQFVHDQLAADLIRPKVENWRLAAMGFLTLGRLFCNNQADIHDDQIDTVSRGLLGLTVSCARCHDHKYDAIPTADYYSLYGIFASSEVPVELPLIEDPSKIPGADAVEKKLAQKRSEIHKHLEAQYKAITEETRRRVGDYLLKILTEAKDPLEEVVFFRSLSPGDLKPPTILRWRRFLERRATKDDPVFGPWRDLTALSDRAMQNQAKVVIERWKGVEPGVKKGRINPWLRNTLSGADLKSRADVALLYGSVFTSAYESSKKPKDELSSAMRAGRDQLVALLTEPEGPVYFSRRSTYLHMTRVPRNQFRSALLEMDKIAVHAKTVAARARVVVDTVEPFEARIFVRGNPLRPGERVPRRFLQVLSDNDRVFKNGSGRLELARAVTARDNPLTARVIANRVWMHHFGEPLVRTPNDFGTRSEPPTHPELLDYLASLLQENDWSIKRLHRVILLSSTYRQTSIRSSDKAKAIDPENRLLWRARRRRLDLESMRDAMLSVSGRLSSEFFGRPVDVAGDPKNRRRTVYGLVDRQDLPGLYRAFDFASPDQSTGRRPRTIVAQQALFGLNSPFMMEQARGVVARLDPSAEIEERVGALYQIVLSRDPSPEELQLASRFVRAAPKQSTLTPWGQLAQVLLLTNEFTFID